MSTDLTVGKPTSVLWKFCMPLFFSMIFQQLYSIVDSLVAGKFISEMALAAVGNSYEITLIFIAFGTGCSLGCSVIVSRYFGAKDYKSVKTAVSTALISTGVLTIVLMAIGLLGGAGLLSLIKTPAEIFKDSELYLMIYVLSLPFVFFYNIATGIFSALGDSRTPFIFLACSSVANIALDFVFVLFVSKSVASVAWATFICQGVSCILSLLFVAKALRKLENAERGEAFSWKLLWQMAKIAIPAIIQQSLISVGNIIIQRVINGFGSFVVAGYAAAVKLNNLIITALTTLGNGISNYTAQNIGAKKFERVKSGFFAGGKLVCMICIPVALVYFFFGKNLALMFLDDPSSVALSTATVFLKIVAPFYIVIALKLVADGILKGAELMGRFMVSTLMDLFLRVVLSIVLSNTSLGSNGIWLSWPIGWFIGASLSLIFTLTIKWQKEKTKKA